MAEKKYLDYDGLLYYNSKIKGKLDDKVDKVSGSSLMTTAEHTKLANIDDSADVNKIESISVNNTAQTITNKNVNITVPTKIGDLTNDGNYVTDANYVHTDTNFTAADKAKLDGIAEGANAYTLPAASSTILGGIKVGTGLGVGDDGKLYVTGDATVNSVEWSVVQNTPTTISGYGITDASVSGQTVSIGGTSVTVPTKVSQLTDASNYLTAETDPIFSASAASGITSDDITTWNGKQNKLTAGTNITISGNTISAKDTTYTAGTGISITNGVIANTQTSAVWGNITGTLSSQTDLQNALNAKQDNISIATGSSSRLTFNSTANTLSFDESNLVTTSAMTTAITNAVPTKVSQLTNDSSYATTSDVASAVAGVTQISYSVVTDLPETGAVGVIYLKSHGEETSNIYDEFIYINGAYELLGTTATDLSDYQKSAELVAITNAEIDTIVASN